MKPFWLNTFCLKEKTDSTAQNALIGASLRNFNHFQAEFSSSCAFCATISAANTAALTFLDEKKQNGSTWADLMASQPTQKQQKK